MTPSDVFVVRHKDGRYLCSGHDSRGRHFLTRDQRLARRFASVLGAWQWVSVHSHSGGDGVPRSFYRPVRLVPTRRCCGCP